MGMTKFDPNNPAKMRVWEKGCPAFELVDNSMRQCHAKTHAYGSRVFHGRYSALCSDAKVFNRVDRVEQFSNRRVPIGIWEADSKGKSTVKYCKYLLMK